MKHKTLLGVEWLTLAQAAAVLGRSKRSVWEAVNRKQIKADTTNPKRWLIHRDEVIRAEHAQTPGGTHAKKR